MPDRRLRCARITLGYDGTDFAGSQSQPGVRTVQDELQRAIDTVAHGSERCVLAGRTDKGVHAHGQVASVNVRWTKVAGQLRESLDAVSPADVIIRHVAWAEPGFHARHDARWREYRYRIVVSERPPVFDARFAWWRRMSVDDDAAADAARRFIGRHSFGAFAGHGWSRSREREELVRTVRECEWRRSDAWDGLDHRVSAELRVTASGFLPRMVRNMVSAIVTVGTGARSPAWIDDLIASGARQELGDAAPPHGLTLWRVTYDEQDDVSAGSRSPGECEYQ
ncbi:MAG TPA: tRNA pseudouridine(38-40) synthase TruA [Thermomicrobiales bacterium]|nr:tRNA pseudouridine(38-40) synthase TruA [Thermomicrobiales bacterium]